MQVEQIDRDAGARLMTLWDDGDLHCDDFVEAFARHRHQVRAEVVQEVVAWLRKTANMNPQLPGEKALILLLCNAVEAKFGKPNVAD